MQDMWRRNLRQLTPGSMMLVSPNWPMALSVVEQEHAAKRNLPPPVPVSLDACWCISRASAFLLLLSTCAQQPRAGRGTLDM